MCNWFHLLPFLFISHLNQHFNGSSNTFSKYYVQCEWKSSLSSKTTLSTVKSTYSSLTTTYLTSNPRKIDQVLIHTHTLTQEPNTSLLTLDIEDVAKFKKYCVWTSQFQHWNQRRQLKKPFDGISNNFAQCVQCKTIKLWPWMYARIMEVVRLMYIPSLISSLVQTPCWNR